MNMKKAFIISMLMAPILAGVLVTIHLSLIFYTPYEGKNTTFTISPGEGFGQINYRLASQELIQNARLFHYYTKYRDSLNKFKAGTYEIKTGYNMKDVFETLTKGTPILNSVTFPEGKNMFEMGKILEENGVTTYESFLAATRDPKLISQLGIEGHTAEGYLFPDTYKFAPGTPANLVVTTMVKHFHQKVKDVNFAAAAPLSKHDVVILASIVEKETGAKWERPTIAGVYLNRLKKKMRLYADPTTIYGIWESYDGNLTKKHLQTKTEYNTYKISGLPKGPIANPSLAAIKAVIEPAEHNFLYFVSKNDGTHEFTPTYKDHQKAVEYWQKNYRNRAGKSWRDLKKQN